MRIEILVLGGGKYRELGHDCTTVVGFPVAQITAPITFLEMCLFLL